MFRLPEDGAVINRYGFNSEGKEAAAGRLAAFWRRHGWRVAVPGGASTSSSSSDAGDAAAAREALARIRALAAPPRGLVGVNLGKNKEGDAKSDYVAGEGRRRFSAWAAVWTARLRLQSVIPHPPHHPALPPSPLIPPHPRRRQRAGAVRGLPGGQRIQPQHARPALAAGPRAADGAAGRGEGGA